MKGSQCCKGMGAHLMDLLLPEVIHEQGEAAHGAGHQRAVARSRYHLYQASQQLRPLVGHVPATRGGQVSMGALACCLFC